MTEPTTDARIVEHSALVLVQAFLMSTVRFAVAGCLAEFLTVTLIAIVAADATVELTKAIDGVETYGHPFIQLQWQVHELLRYSALILI